MKTPEEIKKGLEVCPSRNDCMGICPYEGTNMCRDSLMKDALTYIRQLESRLARAKKDLAFKEKCLEWRYRDIAMAEDMLDEINAKLAKVEKERDAAVSDVLRDPCEVCKHGPTAVDDCLASIKSCKFEWRGVCSENSKEESM